MLSQQPSGGRAFTRAEMQAGSLKLLREGHAANARVSLFSCRGRDWTVKDFSSRSFPVRTFLAPFLFWRELKAIRALKGVDGVPSEGFRIDRNAIAVSFVPGESLSRVLGREPERMTVTFLKAMEDLMERVHRAGLVHLDARGTGNWVVRPDGTPGLIDFQAAVGTRWLPRGLRRILEDVDMSGVLKKWQECHPEAMGPERAARLRRGNRLRSLWRIKGYLGLRK